jgi:hypothetical protein
MIAHQGGINSRALAAAYNAASDFEHFCQLGSPSDRIAAMLGLDKSGSQDLQ